MNINFLDPYTQNAPVVLLLHGLGADSTSWGLQTQVLGDAGFRPLAIDIPGFGKSPFSGRGWGVERAAKSVAQFLQTLETGPVHVVGLSMGGVIAQQLTLDYPERVTKLALASTFANLRPEKINQWLYFFRRLLLVHLLGLPAQARFVAQRVFPSESQAALREVFYAQVIQANPRAYRAAIRALGFFNSSKRLSEIKIPTLVITAENDNTVSPTAQKLLVESIPGARQVVIPHAGHAVSIDQPEAFNLALVEFLNS